MAALVSFGVGLLFALGLGLAGMTDPGKVVGFLDVTGPAWNPALMLVLGGAVLTYAVVFRLTMRRARPVAAPRFMVPSRRDLTPRLVAGATFFGAGWGLAGFCPGPAIASLPTLRLDVWLFVGSMVAGMVLFQVWERAVARHALRAEAAAVPPSRVPIGQRS